MRQYERYERRFGMGKPADMQFFHADEREEIGHHSRAFFEQELRDDSDHHARHDHAYEYKRPQEREFRKLDEEKREKKAQSQRQREVNHDPDEVVDHRPEWRLAAQYRADVEERRILENVDIIRESDKQIRIFIGEEAEIQAFSHREQHERHNQHECRQYEYESFFLHGASPFLDTKSIDHP